MSDQETFTGQSSIFSSTQTILDHGPPSPVLTPEDDPIIDGYSKRNLLPEQQTSDGLFSKQYNVASSLLYLFFEGRSDLERFCLILC